MVPLSSQVTVSIHLSPTSCPDSGGPLLPLLWTAPSLVSPYCVSGLSMGMECLQLLGVSDSSLGAAAPGLQGRSCQHFKAKG